MKICFVNSYYPPWIGGAETYVSNLSRALAQRGHEVTVYCSGRPLKAGETLVDGIRIVRMRAPLTFYGTPMVLFPASFMTQAYDVIHANFPSPYLAGVSAINSEIRSIPSVLTWHNDLPPVTSAAQIVVSLHELISPAYLGFYDKIIATTEQYARKSIILRRFSSKVEVIKNGVNTSKFNTLVDGSEIRELYGIPEDTKVALFVGGLTAWHTYKGVDVLIKAFALANKKFRNMKLLVVGGGELLEEYKMQAKEMGLNSEIVFTGRVGDEELPKYYAACNYAVLPSKDSSEGFGLVLLEAMASGKPVIGSRVGGIADVINERETGFLVPPNDEVALSEVMTLLSSDDNLRARMGAMGRKYAELYDWNQVAQRVESLYTEICV